MVQSIQLQVEQGNGGTLLLVLVVQLEEQSEELLELVLQSKLTTVQF
jgi:hypothetical protein